MTTRQLTCVARAWLAGALAALLGCAAPARADEGHHSFWVVHGAHNTVYLMGSVHVLKPTDSDLPPEAMEAYRRAGALVMEVDLNEAQSEGLTDQTLRESVLPPGQTLASVLGAETYEKFATHARAVGLDPALVAGCQPWFAAMTLLRLQYVQLGYDFESGVESQFARQAAADHKPVIGLETMAEQMGLFSHLSLAEQRRFLLYTLDDADETPKEIDDIVAAWRRGDANALNALLAQGFEQYPELYGPLTSDRNRRWMAEFTTLLGDRKDYLVIVGALHLVGHDGLLELLRARGYRIEQH